MAVGIINKSAEKLEKLLEILRHKSSLLIIMQDHPDPDAVGSATALRRIANSCNTNCSLGHSGMLGRAENRALVNYLGLNLRRVSEIDFANFDLIALVDTQPGTGNNPLPHNILPHIVIDHHPIHKATRSVQFTDVRGNYGATSTILCEYLMEAGIQPEPPLATALLYGIRSDTQNLGRQARKADFDAHYFLYHYANLKMLSQIEHSPLPRRYYQLLFNGLRQARVIDGTIFTSLGKVENPDITGEIADLLVRREGIQWCLCCGVVKKTLLLSLRSRDPGADAGATIRRIIGKIGTGGGHNMLAGGQIPLTSTSAQEVAKTADRLYASFRHVMHLEDTRPQALVRKSK